MVLDNVVSLEGRRALLPPSAALTQRARPRVIDLDKDEKEKKRILFPKKRKNDNVENRAS